MIRHRPLVRSPFLIALALAVGCQPVAKDTSGERGDEEIEPTATKEVLIRQIPAAQKPGEALLFPPTMSDRHGRKDLVLGDDDERTLSQAKELEVRSPWIGDDKSFEFRGKCFRVVFTHEIDLAREPSLKRPLKADDGILSIEPAVKGKAQWTSGNVLEFCAERGDGAVVKVSHGFEAGGVGRHGHVVVRIVAVGDAIEVAEQVEEQPGEPPGRGRSRRRRCGQ